MADSEVRRLFCDEMLAALTRWLRAAGHDTTLAEASQPDRELLALCRAEDRVFISRDRHLTEIASRTMAAVLLSTQSLDGQAAELTAALGLDWLAAPFTRCMMDNTPLREADAGELALIPETSRRLPGPFRVCPACGRRYWPGSHVRRMTARLERWNR